MTIMLSSFLSPAQLLGYAAMATTLSAFLLRDDDALRRRAALGSVLWCAHFGLLGAMTASVLAGLVGLRQFVSGWLLQRTRPLQIGAALAFVVAFTVLTCLTWHGALSLLPWVSSVNATLAFIFMSGVVLRRQLVFSDIALFGNALASGSVGGAITHALAIGLNSHMAWRLHQRSRMLVGAEG